MSLTRSRLQLELEQECWKQTLKAMESAAQAKVVDLENLVCFAT